MYLQYDAILPFLKVYPTTVFQLPHTVLGTEERVVNKLDMFFLLIHT